MAQGAGVAATRAGARESDMNPARYRRLMELFEEACLLPAGEQVSLIARVRAQEPTIADELAELLEQDRARGDMFDSHDGRLDVAALEAGAPDPAIDQERSEQPDSERSAPDPNLGSVVAGRYRLDARLGAGGMGQVYRALDLDDGRDVAVKLLRPELIHDPRQIQRFRREFRAISRIDHPGCVSVFAEGVHDQRRYIVMEYVPGGNLGRLAGAPDRVLLPVFIQLAAALDCIHNRRIIHRDLKPANVLLAAGDPPAPKLVDFGIVKVVDEASSRLTESGALLGTVDYLAPEQIEGEALDPRSDLYSLGCVMFELWAGRPPFAGAPFQRLRARLERAPVRLRELAPRAPERVDDLTARLLDRDPARRPRRAADVARELAEIWAEESDGPASVQVLDSLSEPRAGGFLYRPGLIGRESLRADLLARIDAAAAGRSSPLIAVHGAAGLGKTALMSSLARALAQRGDRVVTVARHGAGVTPFAPFPSVSSALDAALGRPPRAGPRPPAPRGPGGSAGVRHHKVHVPADDAAVARHQLAGEIADKLRAAHEHEPVVLIIEDLHGADATALELLLELVGKLGASGKRAPSGRDPERGADPGAGRRPVIVATMRPAGRARLEAAMRDRDAVSFMALEPLGRGAVGQIAAAMLAVTASSVPDRLVAHLTDACDGNPLLVQSALHGLADRGHLRLASSGWTLETDNLDAALSIAVGEVLRLRLAALGDATRAILSAAAVCGSVFDAELLCRVAQAPEDAVLDALDEAIRASVVRVIASASRRDDYAFEHERLAEVLRSELDIEERRRYHDAAGEVWDERGTASPATLAFHFARGSDESRAYRYLREAGFWAFEARDYQAAQHHLRAALDRVDSLDEGIRERARIECAEPLADALIVAGHTREGMELLRELARLDAPPATRARWLRKLGLALMRTADVAEGLATLDRALGAVGDAMSRRRLAVLWRVAREVALTVGRRVLGRAPAYDQAGEERALIHRELAFMYRWIDLERSLAHLSAFVRLAYRLGVDTYLVDAHAGAGFLCSLLGWPRLAARNHDRARQLALDAHDMRGLSRLEVVQGGTVAVLTGDEEATFAHCDRGVEVAEELGDRFLIDFVLTMRGWAGVLMNRWQSAADDFRRAGALAVELDVPWLRDDAACGNSLVELLHGQLESASQAARRVLSSDVRLALPVLDALATEVLGAEALMSGRFRDAIAYFARARARYLEHHLYRGWGMLTKVWHCEALLCLADEQGQEAVPNLMRELRRNARRARRRQRGVSLYRGHDALLLGAYESRRGNERAARRLFARARSACADGGHRFIQLWIRARLAFEGWRLGDPREAVSAELDGIDEIYASMGLAGMRSWLSRLRRIHGLD